MNPSPPTGSRSFLGLDARFLSRSLLIGVLPMLALLAVLSGSLANALQMILVSTVCTLGIAGFFWVGVATLFGTVLQLLVPALRAGPAAGPAAAGGRAGLKAPASGPEDAVSDLLTNYASAKLGEGASEEGIRRDLLWSGWSEPQATAALEQAQAHLSATPGAGSGRVGDGG